MWVPPCRDVSQTVYHFKRMASSYITFKLIGSLSTAPTENAVSAVHMICNTTVLWDLCRMWIYLQKLYTQKTGPYFRQVVEFTWNSDCTYQLHFGDCVLTLCMIGGVPVPVDVKSALGFCDIQFKYTMDMQ